MQMKVELDSVSDEDLLIGLGSCFELAIRYVREMQYRRRSLNNLKFDPILKVVDRLDFT